MKKKYELQPEHRAQLDGWARRWIATAMSTAAMTDEEREICCDAVRRMYRAAKLEPPPDHRIVFVPSPFVLRFASGFATAIWWLRKSKEEISTKIAVRDTAEAATRDATWAATRDATAAVTWAATWDATGVATGVVTGAATRDVTWAATWAATRAATEAATWAAIRDATRDATAAVTWAATWDATGVAIRDVTGAATGVATWATTRAATAAATVAATVAATEAATVAATVAATRAATWAATWAATEVVTRDAIRAVTWATTEVATRDATDVVTWAATRDTTWAATGAATEVVTGDATRAATEVATWAAIRDTTWATTGAVTRAATRDATWDATWDATRDATSATAQAMTRDATRTAMGNVGNVDLSRWYVFSGDMVDLSKHIGVGDIGLKCASSNFNMLQGGNQWSSYACFLSFFRHVVKLDIDYSAWDAWEVLAEHSGPRIVHQDFCMISDRPEILLVDDENRPHCDTGPFCRWRDGSALYAVHGIYVPAWIIEHPKDITIAAIDTETNVEIRRIMIDRYGPGRYLEDAGAILVHRDDWGSLYRRELNNDETLVMVKVVNSTPESDGTFKDYWMRVHPQLRPLLPDGSLGSPQEMTARNAVASTFGLTGNSYNPSIQT